MDNVIQMHGAAVADGLGQQPAKSTPLGDKLTGAAAANLPFFFREVEIRTTATPPVVFTTQELISGEPAPEVAVARKALRPTIILRGGALGTQVIAPDGRVNPNQWKTTLTLVAVGGLLVGGLAASLLFRAGRGFKR